MAKMFTETTPRIVQRDCTYIFATALFGSCDLATAMEKSFCESVPLTSKYVFLTNSYHNKPHWKDKIGQIEA